MVFNFEKIDYYTLFKNYQQIAEMLITHSGIWDYCINDDVFADAAKSIEQDLNIIAYRRQLHQSGISDGKVAGILAFRLARAQILSFCPANGINHPFDKFLNAAVALAVTLLAINVNLNTLSV